jgi:hypothetical protein
MRPVSKLLALVACAFVAAFSSPDPQPVEVDPTDPTTREEVLESIDVSGLYLLDVESIAWHVHARLVVVVDGVEVVVPQVGVDLDTMTAAPVHTHGPDGILHVEADEAHVDREITVADFLSVWGMGREAPALCRSFTGTPECTVSVSVDGDEAGLDHALGDRQVVVLNVERVCAEGPPTACNDPAWV